MNTILSHDSVSVNNRFGLKPALLETIIINEKVTYKVHFAMSLSDDDIRKAGKSGLKFSNGVLVNKRRIFISDGYSGKMHDMPGCSGFAGNNSLCLQRALNGHSVCSHCFSLVGLWKSCIPAYTKNDLIFSTEVFQPGDLILDPRKFPYFRYSTHGDTINSLHVRNVMVSSMDNPKTQFTIWTKNLKYWVDGLKWFKEEFGFSHKPSNLFALYSPLQTDPKPSDIMLKSLKAIDIDAYFGVYETWASQDSAVARGAKRCLCGLDSCRHYCKFCYDRAVRELSGFADSDKAIWVAEILDGAKHKE